MDSEEIIKLKTLRTGRVVVKGNQKNPNYVWIVCHGYAQLATEMPALFSALERNDTLLVFPEGLSRFYAKGGGGKVAASWMTKEEREDEIADYINWLDTVHVNVVPKHFGGKLVVLGFSQGGATACRWVSFSRRRADVLVLYSATFPPDLKLSESTNSLPPTINVLGDKDQYISQEEKLKQLDIMKSAGVAVTPLDFEGGHEVLPEVLQKIEALIRK